MPIDTRLRPAVPRTVPSERPTTTPSSPALPSPTQPDPSTSAFDLPRVTNRPAEGRTWLGGNVLPPQPQQLNVPQLPQVNTTPAPAFNLNNLNNANRPVMRNMTNGKVGTDDDSVGFGGRGENAGVGAPDADSIALQQAIGQRLETPSYLREPSSQAARNLSGALTQAGSLLSSRAATTLARDAKASVAAGANLERLMGGLSGLSEGVRSSLLKTAAGDLGGVAGSVVSHLVGSSAFKNLSTGQKQQLSDVLARLDAKGLTSLGAIAENAPQIFNTTDSKGGSFLDNLTKLATQPLSAKIAQDTSTEEVLNGVLKDISNPNSIDQGTAPTCTVTSMQFELVADQPAEYARLMAELTSSKGSADMQGGSALKLGPTDARSDARAGRNVSQSIFQTSAMEYANGRFSDFDPVAGRSTNARTGESIRGLRPDSQKLILEKLFGVKYSTNRLQTPAEGQRALEKMRGFNAADFPNRPVLLDLDQGAINHAVTLERIDQGRVYFRDPYGALRSMPESMWAQNVVAIHKPLE